MCVPVPDVQYRVAFVAVVGYTIVNGELTSSGAPVAEVTVLVNPMNTSAVVDTVEMTTVSPGLTSHSLIVVGLVGAVTW